MLSLSRYVIMQVLLAAAFIVQQIVQIPAHWLVNRANLMRTKGKISLSTTKNNFHFPPYFSFPHYNRPLSRGGHFVSGDLKALFMHG